MNRDELRSRLDEFFDVFVRTQQHQVRVEEKRGVAPAEVADDLRPEREIRHEIAVHDVEMHPFEPVGDDDGEPFGEGGMIRRKNRRGENFFVLVRAHDEFRKVLLLALSPQENSPSGATKKRSRDGLRERSSLSFKP